MAKTFLRSGNLNAVLALGENGQPVYASALQIRETLRLRRHNALADCLAIPQANERGDRLDWYAPFSGRVKSWLAAGDHERQAALHQLTAYQQDIQALSARARTAENPAMRLFGALLSKTLQFPDQQYVYLVDGKPVITFWGFVDAHSASRDDALACLRETLNETLPETLVEPLPAPPATTPVTETVTLTEPEEAGPLPVIAAPEPRPEPPVAARRRFRLWPLLPVAAVVAAVTVAVLLQRPAPSSTAAPAAAATQPAVTPQTVTAPAANTAPSAAASSPGVPQEQPAAGSLTTARPPASLPQTPASVVATETAPPAVADRTPPVPAKADDLIVTPDAVREGQVQAIDGHWRVTIDQVPTPTGKPPVMRFQFKNGKGSVLVTQANTRCKADVTAAMTRAGNLVVESRYRATCQDGSRYRMPLLVCHASMGAAACEAQFTDDRVFPMTIKRESK